MKSIYKALILICLTSAQGCSNGASTEPSQSATDVGPSNYDSSIESSDENGSNGYASGDANVHYYNPNTGTQSNYDLDVDYDSNGDVERINFNNGGWIDDSHITDQSHNGDGTITVTDDRGYEYTVDESPDSPSSDESEEVEADSYE